MGAPAAAAPSTDASALTKATSLTEGKAGAMRMVGANQLNLARGGWQGGWDAPWDIDPQALLSALNGTAVSTAPIQSCGSTAAFVAAVTVPITSPNTLVAKDKDDDHGRGGYGDKDKLACANGNLRVVQSDEVPLVALANNTAVSAAALQACGSTASFAVGVAAPITSPNTVIGGCDNGNIDIVDEDEDEWGGDKWDDHSDGYGSKWKESARTEGSSVSAAARQALAKKVSALKTGDGYGWKAKGGAYGKTGGYGNGWKAKSASVTTAPVARGGGWDAPWDVDPFGLAAALNGTAVATASLQACGATAAFVAGVSLPITSPNTEIGDCKNANIKIDQQDSTALLYAANNTAISIANIQACGSTTGTGVGIAAPITSPNTVIGSCYNANIAIS
ncbi:hypothetical protein [Catellatospora tritici]|uniref:hypothetical protein n=1 Tax=Catellatospora tritici TaxID=2851566 RepID=UPI001C2DA94D|nr:hypothetical protein [Catellatospora tritici]MBV1855680.1 hypothetical protein [Catellatospora tritici]